MKKEYRVAVEVKGDGMGMNNKEEKAGNELFLSKLLAFDKICIQCHDNPDPDAIASSFALYYFFKKYNKDVRMIYGGRNKITKANLRLMIRELEIPIEHVTELPECDILVTTDCQYGSGNVTSFEAPMVAMIDHHQCGILQNQWSYIRSNLASCSTVVWELMRQLNVDVNEDERVSTALYYGLYCDSGQFEELYHPLDKDMRDSLSRNDSLLFQLYNTNLSIEELEIASKALSDQEYYNNHHFSICETEPCDPNILGIISDFIIQVQEVDFCVAFNQNPGGYKISVRSCTREVKANELAQAICEGMGNGGGHLTKAGGFIAKQSYEERYGNRTMKQAMAEIVKDYYDSYEIIEAQTYDMDTSDMGLYQKLPVKVGYVVAREFLQERTPILVRTLEGDVDLIVTDDLYLMIGIEGEVYPINEEKFERSYLPVDGEAEFNMEYEPTVRDNVFGHVYQLIKYMKACVNTGEVRIYAKQLERNVKVFTAWDKNKYYRGQIGDFIVVREDDPHDIYVVQKDIFYRTYAECEKE